VVVSHFEKILESDIRLSFFIPIIVYMSDAVGTQTETIYVRHLQRKTLDFWKYFFKEVSLGISLGIIFGIATGIFAFFWL
jgi:magnesium transporter